MELTGLIREPVFKHPDKIATIFGEKQTTFAELDARSNSLANALLSLGLTRGDRVAILSKNSPEYREAYLAIIKAGLVIVPLNYRLSEIELSHVINDSKPSVLIIQDELADLVFSMRSGANLDRKFIYVTHNLPDTLHYEDLISAHSPEYTPVETDEEDLTLLIYTSGTTGLPKGVMTTRKNLARYIIKSRETFGDLSDKVCLLTMPMHGSAGLMFDLRYSASGATTVIMDKFDPVLVLQAIEKYHVNDMFLVPTAINLLLNELSNGNYNTGSLEQIIYTGSPMPLKLLEKGISLLGNIFMQIYGSTETIGISYLLEEAHIIGSKQITSAGKPQPDVQVKIVDDSSVEQPRGEMGEIIVKSDTAMKGYLGLPEETAEALKDGWVHTGDVGFMDNEGFIYIRDRKKDMIISGGSNIFPAEIENIIMTHPSVLEVAVIGVPDQLWGECPMAIIHKKGGKDCTQEEIIDLCKSKLASYKKPKYVAFVDNLPKTSTGKVQKRLLREKFKDEVSDQSPA